MSYVNKHHRRLGHPLMGFGAFDDETQCSQIPIGDPYRKPGNYCATPDGGTTTFNADGTTYRAPGAVDPDPAHPAKASGGSIWDIFKPVVVPTPGPVAPLPPQTGMSTTTMIALGGGAVLLALLLLK